MFTKKHLLILAFSIFGTASAHAGILFEPYLGYEFGKIKQTGSEDIDVKGPNFGARLGYQTFGFRIGADYMMSIQDAKQGSRPTTDYDTKDLGVFVGYEFPVVLQVYANYFISSKADLDPDTYTKEFSGDGVRLGAGWTGLPFVVINLEYIMRTYKKYGDTKLAEQIKASTVALTVSLPLP